MIAVLVSSTYIINFEPSYASIKRKVHVSFKLVGNPIIDFLLVLPEHFSRMRYYTSGNLSKSVFLKGWVTKPIVERGRPHQALL